MTVKVDTLANEAGTGPTNLTGQIAAKARLWHDLSTQTVEESLNVSSVTDVATGEILVNFTNSFSNVYYTIGAWGGRDGAGSNAIFIGRATGDPSPTASATTLRAWTQGGNSEDAEICTSNFIGDLA